jgi:hypothetical protein
MSQRCGFCGKGPFPTVPGLHKHIGQSVKCRQASKKEFGKYVDDVCHEHLPSTADAASFVDEQMGVSNLVEPSSTLDTDINQAGVDCTANENLTPSSPLQSRRATVEEVPDEEAPLPPSTEPTRKEAVFVESFPEEAKAGAAWRTGISQFTSIHRTQEAAGDGKWGPFEDEDEWQLAEWLIKNVGQKQTDTYLKLPIVSQTVMLLTKH